MKAVGEGIKAHCPNAFVICITNPLDAMVWALREFSGLPHNKVVGMAGVLDSARFRHFLAEEFRVAVKDVNAFVLGGHGDTMVPVTAIRPSPASRSRSDQDGLVDEGADRRDRQAHPRRRRRDRRAVEDRQRLLCPGDQSRSPWPRAISKDKKRILPAAAHLTGQYGVDDLYVGVPMVIGAGRRRAESIEIELGETKQAKFQVSVDAVKELLVACKQIDGSLA